MKKSIKDLLESFVIHIISIENKEVPSKEKIQLIHKATDELAGVLSRVIDNSFTRLIKKLT